MTDRPSIPDPLKRKVKMEAGHRCAIPTCQQVPIDIAHIDPWSKVKVHTFENLIALCPNCHRRFDNGEIDRPSMIQYKANLSIINDRYSDLEQRVLKYFAEYQEQETITMSGGLDLLLIFLIQDGYLEENEFDVGLVSGVPTAKTYKITKSGREFIQKWVSAENLD